MNTKKLQRNSIILIILSVLVELSESQAWIDYASKEVPLGISFAFVIVSLSFNIKVIKTIGIPKSEKKKSQLLVLISTLYLVLIYGFELI